MSGSGHLITLAGQRVVVREFRPGDLDGVYAIVSDDRVTRWLSFDSRTWEQADEMLTGVLKRAGETPRTEYYLAVSLLDSADVVGFVRLGLSGVNAAKLGFAVHFDHWGHGYISEATAVMIQFGFETLGLRRISAAVGPDNVASIAVVKRLGFRYEGRLRDHVFTNRAWRDSLLYSLLEPEWMVDPR